MDYKHKLENFQGEVTSPAILRSTLKAKKRLMMSLTDVVASAEEKNDLDQIFAEPTTNPDAYLRLLHSRHTKAMQMHHKEQEEARRAEAALPALDRFNVRRDGKILAQWQERQRDWANIQTKIKAQLQTPQRLGAPPPPHALLMETIDEYRAKMEEFDAIDVARPVPTLCC